MADPFAFDPARVQRVPFPDPDKPPKGRKPRRLYVVTYTLPNGQTLTDPIVKNRADKWYRGRFAMRPCGTLIEADLLDILLMFDDAIRRLSAHDRLRWIAAAKA